MDNDLKAHEFAWYSKFLAHKLNVLPVFLPLTTLVRSRFISRVPIPHINRG